MPQFELDKANIDRVEYNISPPMKAAITIPVKVDGKDLGVAVYLCTSPFTLGNPFGADLIAEIASRLAVTEDVPRGTQPTE